MKLSEILLLRLRATFHTLPLFHLRTQILRNVRMEKLRDSGINPNPNQDGQGLHLL